MVFIQHQLFGLRDLFVVKLSGIFQRKIWLLHDSFFYLNKGHDGIIYDPDKLTSFIFLYLLMLIFLQTSNALCFYKNLIRERGKTKYSPCTSIIVHFADKQRPAYFNLVVVLI